jgi:hypothetical protein
MFGTFGDVRGMAHQPPEQLPDPDELLAAALNEPSPRLLDDYAESIHALREKHFSFREIAEWLKQYGFDVDHNAVYRAYAKTVPDDIAEQAARDDEQTEDDEFRQQAELNGTPTPSPASVEMLESSVKKSKRKREKRRKSK